jgi:plastocyanin
LLLLADSGASAASLQAAVKNQDGEPVQNAVVIAMPASGASRAPKSAKLVNMDQVGKEFVPHTLALQLGTTVQFPNKDQIRHHVYSFSDAKTFEIPLYKGTPSEPVVFDTPGVVVLGCNIHDWMRGYVYVAESPHFAITDDKGRAQLPGLAAGNFDVTVWHPSLKNDPGSRSISSESTPEVEFQVELKKAWKPRRGPRGGRKRY